MNHLCSDLLLLFTRYGRASVVYTLALSTRKRSRLFISGQYTEESKRRLTTIEKITDDTRGVKSTMWTPQLPNGQIEGVTHIIEEHEDGSCIYEVITCRNVGRYSVKHGLWITYHIDRVYVVSYVDGIKDGLEQRSLYDGTITLRRNWVNGNVVY